MIALFIFYFKALIFSSLFLRACSLHVSDQTITYKILFDKNRMGTKKERREWPRNQVRHPVFFKYCDSKKEQDKWFYAQTEDISVSGMRISQTVTKFKEDASRLRLIFIPKAIRFGPQELEPEPIWIEAKVAWKDESNNTMGLCITR